MGTTDQNRPAPWGETLLALGPILIAMLDLLAMILARFTKYLNDPVFALGLQFTLLGLLLIALLAGWVKNFPRWVFPYWGFALLISFYFYNFSGTISGQWFTGDWRVWIPLGVVALAGLLRTGSLRPLLTLIKSVWKDWTLLSFAFYGALPLLCFAAYDETRSETLIRLLPFLILAVGAVFYMRLENPWHRFASLVGGFTLGWLALMVHLGWYWNGRQEYWMNEPGTWMDTFNWTSRFGATLMLILVAPVLVELLRHTVTSLRIPRPPLHKPSGN